ncbi:hypothetical protein L1987_06023 [Smallanthus sonchifolius]|uniref:Uncharacterized protein n=1 Tax=Smallanthus sonchifolius TaxID=185202 RepID=A0ACB9JX59_9ASTR|nr:hypothetical protein L1987_06023 [Smallanthus sonchifolius]
MYRSHLVCGYKIDMNWLCADSSEDDFQKPLNQLKKSSDQKRTSTTIVTNASTSKETTHKKLTSTSVVVHEVLGIPMGKVQFGNLKNPTIKDAVIAEFRKQFDITYKPPTPIELFNHLKERYKRTNPGKNQILAISFLKNDAINKLSANDEEKEKEKGVKTETVKGDRKRKRDDKEGKEIDVETETVKGHGKRKRGDKEAKEHDPSAIINDYWQRRSYYESTAASKPAHPTTESEWKHMIKPKTKALDTYMSETHELIVEGYGKYKSEEIFDAIDEWRFRLKHYGDKYNNKLNEDKAAQPEKGENEEKRTQSQKMMVSLFDTTQFHFSDSILEDVVTEMKKVEGQNNNEGAEIVDDVIKNGEKSGKTSSSKPSVQGAKAGTGSVGLKTAQSEDEKPTQVKKVNEDDTSKTAQDVEVKKEKQHKVKEVDVGEGKVDEQKVVGEDAGKTAQVGGFETPAPKSKDHVEAPVNVEKVNEDDTGKTAQDGEVKAGEGKVDEQKVVGEDAGKTAQIGGFETPTPKSKKDSEVPVFIGVNLNKKNKEQTKNAARATRPAEALCSPIFVFQNATGINIPRICMESFHPNEYLHVNAMTCWSLVLNSEEIYRSRGRK